SDIRIKWTKACARADRWHEEVILLEEEMRRVLEYCAWKVKWWEDRRNSRTGVSAELAEGLQAYATEQAARERYWSWQAKWAAVRVRAETVLANNLGDVAEVVGVEVELEEEVAYGEYEDEEGEPDEDLLD
ncbi:hypothetical protein K438DRAFT_1601641, partial [Mycena galopus ATCC 62051]